MSKTILENKKYDKIVDYEAIPEKRKNLGLCLLARHEEFALYVTNCFSFEVHLIRVRENYVNPFNKTLYQRIEVVASSEEFGQYAWCFERLSTVFRYFGFFAAHLDEIVENLEHYGFEQVTMNEKKEVVSGYVF